MNSSNRLTARRIALIKAVLADGIKNAHDIAARVGLCIPRAEDYLELMVSEGLIHVKCWKARPEGKQQRIAHFALGVGKNAPKPPAYTPAERMALVRAGIRKDADAYDAMLSRDRTQKRVRRQVKVPQSWLSALGV